MIFELEGEHSLASMDYWHGAVCGPSLRDCTAGKNVQLRMKEKRTQVTPVLSRGKVAAAGTVSSDYPKSVDLVHVRPVKISEDLCS